MRDMLQLLSNPTYAMALISLIIRPGAAAVDESAMLSKRIEWNDGKPIHGILSHFAIVERLRPIAHFC